MSGCSIRAVLQDDYLSELIIENGGNNYFTPPNIFINPPETGSDQATAVVTDLSNNTVYSVLLTNPGSGYNAVPAIYIEDSVHPDIIPAIRGWDTCPNNNPFEPYRVMSSYYLNRFFCQYLPPSATVGYVLSSGECENQWVNNISLSSLNLKPQATAPTTGFTTGTLYYNSSLNQLGYYNGSSWIYI